MANPEQMARAKLKGWRGPMIGEFELTERRTDSCLTHSLNYRIEHPETGVEVSFRLTDDGWIVYVEHDGVTSTIPLAVWDEFRRGLGLCQQQVTKDKSNG